MPTIDVNINKGSRVTAQIFTAQPLGSYSLSGAQMKVAATSRTITGTVTHVRGDHPTAPTSIRIWIKPDDEDDEVIVSPESIIAVEGVIPG